MSDFLEKISQYSPKRLALLADDLQRRLEEMEAKASEPIAIVGIGCRLPGGADTPEKLWDLLQAGTDAISEPPADRWSIDDLYDPDPDAPGKMSTRWGGFLNSVDRFDPHFFGISPREAHSMDPQQRLLLEVAWEALEHAGISPQRVEGTRTGVFVGVSALDYYQVLRADGVEGFDAYTASGTAHSIASGRLSYVLGARGPSISIDTACSSSLVAIHLAVQSLRRGECSMALAGGVNLILGPDITIALSKSRMMAPDGRCKAFDEKADGFVRGEGCGVLVLKPLKAARTHGDRIIAVIRGSASNQDGRSNGLTAPNGPSQEDVIRDALADARVAPSQVSVVEAHGTGTSLGDPIEIQALAAAYGKDRTSPLTVGSIKANLGHLEAAAGVTGLIKLALSLQHGKFPRQLHFHTPNPRIAWDSIPVEVASADVQLPPSERKGAISSFGFSGTNVHMILEQAPEQAAVETGAQARQAHVLTISARDDVALLELAKIRRQELASGSASLADIAFTANNGRAHFAHRLALVAADEAEAIAQLEGYIESGSATGLHIGKASSRAPKIGFLFTGQGAQHAGMARVLYDTQPVFRSALDRCDAILSDKLPKRLLSVIYPAEADADLVNDTEYTQPALFAVEYALAQLWASWGVRPSIVLGHSVGEYVAACLSGVLSLEDSLSLIAERGRLMGLLPRNGAMAAVMADPVHVQQAIAPYFGKVSIAAINGPRNIVISGEDLAITAILERFDADGVSASRLKVSHAFHSPLMAPIADTFSNAASRLAYAPPTIDLVANLTGNLGDAATINARYLREQLLQPVQFAPGVSTMLAAGCNAFIEIGPHPILTGMARQCAPDAKAVWIPSLQRGKDDQGQLLNALALLYVQGANIDWLAFDAPWKRKRATLASYPFQRSRYWVDTVNPVVRASQGQVKPADDLPAHVRSMLYDVSWQPAPSDTKLVDAKSVAQSVEPLLTRLALVNGLDSYADFSTGLDALASRYIVRALADLGYSPKAGDSFEQDELRARLGVLDRHAQLFRRMLAILAEDGILARENNGWRVVNANVSADAEPLAETLLAEHPDCSAELTLTARCGRSLANVLRGEDPLPLLFPEGSLADTENLYQASPPARTYNTLIAEAIKAALQGWPADRPLRVLEIGAGTGSTTAYVLPALEACGTRVDYTFTDVGKVFLQRAKEKFAQQQGMQFAALDVTHDPAGQGFTAASYDIIIAANVLHATPDLAVTVANVRKLAAPGAMLVLLEGSTTQRFGDLTVGMLDGWWAFTDTSRRDYALMPSASWRKLLQEQGFDSVVAIPSATDHPVLLQQAVIIAQAPQQAVAKAAPSRWLIVGDEGGVSAQLSSQLIAGGHTVSVISPVSDFRHALSEALREPWNHVVHMAGLDAVFEDNASIELLEAGIERATGSALVTIQLLASQSRTAAKLHFVTRGGQAAGANDVPQAAQATIWGLSHVVALEHPELGCHRIDLDPALSTIAAADALASEFLSSAQDDQIALRDSQRLVRRIVPHAPTSTPTRAVKIDPERSYFITGGLRGLGLRVAEWLVQQGARHLALMGRNEADPRALATVDRMRQMGVTVLTIKGDVGEEADIRRAFSDIELNLPVLAGVIHSAGALDDAVLAQQNWSRFTTTFKPKVSGSWLLHKLAPDLDFMILFSSGASLAGSGGQANHSAANAFEDALAWRRQAQGLPTVSINWGPWAEIGAAADRKLKSAGGLRAIAPDDGLAALAFAMRTDIQSGRLGISQIGVLNIDSNQPTSKDASSSATALVVGSAAHPVASEQSLRQRIAAAPEGRRMTVLRDQVCALAAAVLGLSQPEQIDINEPFGQLGLDSLMAVELRNRLAKAAERKFPATLTLDYPSVTALVEYLAQEAFADELNEKRQQAEQKTEDTFDDMSADELAQQLLMRLEDFSE